MVDARQQVHLLDVAASPWAGAASRIAGAVLFLDAGAAAAAASAGGAPLLFGLGALAVLDLKAATADAAASSVDGTQPVCVVVTLPLDACLEEVAARVETRPDAQHVTLLCAVRDSEQRRGSYESAAERLDKALRRHERAGDEAHASRDGRDGEEDWDDGEACGGDAGPRGRVTVQHMPLCLAPLGRSALTLPPGSYASEAPLAEPGQFTAHGSLPAPCAPDDSGLGFDAPAGVGAHAAALCAVGDVLGVSWDVFALGPVSTAIARAVATDTSSSSVPTRSAALVLVDRTCDLATPLAPSEALLEHVPQRCATGDVYTDALATALRLPPLAGVAGVTGAHGGAAAALEEVCGRRLREGGLAARKAVLEAMRREGMAPASKPKLGAVAPGELRALATQLRDGVPAPRHAAMVTHALAVADALDGAAAGEPHSAAMRALAAAAADGGCAGAGAWLLRWLSSDPPPSGAALVHALLPVAYALAGDVAPDQDGVGLSQAAGRGGAFHVDRALVQGPFDPQVERAVRDALLRLHAATVGRAWVDARIARLHALAHARRSLRATPARAAAAAPPLHGPCHAVPHLVKALATRAVMKEDIPELTHVPSSLGGLLKSGFGLLGLQARPKPGDHPLVLLFLVGGLSAGELRDAREAAAISGAGAGDPRVELLLGGTSLVVAGSSLVHALWD